MDKQNDEVELNDESLENAAGGQILGMPANNGAPNATMIVYASEFIPMDPSDS
ncbi:MAG: hypothetical protein RL720_531 [Actinomycetota bacterium]|jgi:hypothetical protein